MATAVIMPRQGQSVESCIITKWYKKKGDLVKIGDLLFAYETDKASFEEEAKSEGLLLDIFYNEGDEVPVLNEIAFIGKAGEQLSKPTVQNPEKQKTETAVLKISIEPKEPIEKATNGEKNISPLARKMAQQMGIDASVIKGSGPHGRIIKQDILQQSNSGNIIPTVVSNAETFSSFEYKDAKLTNIRKIIGKAMYASLQNSAQLTHHLSADVRRLIAYRGKLKTIENAPNITLNDLVCHCVIKVLLKMPEVNSHFLGESIRTFNKVHLGLAVDTARGLMVPVLKNANDFSLTGLSSQLKQLADSCKNGSINPDLLSSSGASFTISNLGAYGIEMFTPVINLPQVAILGVCTIISRPADLGNGVFGFVPYMGLSLTYDHRALDGGPATLFLKAIKTEIENFQDPSI